jgi:hypothetical protein
VQDVERKCTGLLLCTLKATRLGHCVLPSRTATSVSPLTFSTFS